MPIGVLARNQETPSFENHTERALSRTKATSEPPNSPSWKTSGPPSLLTASKTTSVQVAPLSTDFQPTTRVDPDVTFSKP